MNDLPNIDPNDHPLATRAGLPEALRVLLDEYPREAWDADPGFSELIRFWLDRHLMFRRMIGIIGNEAEHMLDRKTEPRRFAAQLGRVGSMFVSELHGHHMIEDHQYFPRLKLFDPRVARAFDILDRDHHALDAHLERFTAEANAALSVIGDDGEGRDEAGAFMTGLRRLEGFLDRHLVDEEEVIVPVLLRHVPDGVM